MGGIRRDEMKVYDVWYPRTFFFVFIFRCRRRNNIIRIIIVIMHVYDVRSYRVKESDLRQGNNSNIISCSRTSLLDECSLKCTPPGARRTS